jgi:hypothetical protein
MRQLAIIAMVLSSCGSPKVREVLVREEPVRILPGERTDYVLDANESSRLISRGQLVIEVTEVTEDHVGLKGVAEVDTIVGKKTFEVTGELEQEILTPKWLGEFRRAGTPYQARNALITYRGMTDEGCDTINLDKITGYQDLAIEPTVCVAANTVPTVLVIARQNGTDIKAFFRQKG